MDVFAIAQGEIQIGDEWIPAYWYPKGNGTPRPFMINRQDLTDQQQIALFPHSWESAAKVFILATQPPSYRLVKILDLYFVLTRDLCLTPSPDLARFLCIDSLGLNAKSSSLETVTDSWQLVSTFRDTGGFAWRLDCSGDYITTENDEHRFKGVRAFSLGEGYRHIG